jgi:hypothetical protein
LRQELQFLRQDLLHHWLRPYLRRFPNHLPQHQALRLFQLRLQPSLLLLRQRLFLLPLRLLPMLPLLLVLLP